MSQTHQTRKTDSNAIQDFPNCPTPEEPGTCTVYAELRFPPDIYVNINEFWEERAEAENDSN